MSVEPLNSQYVLLRSRSRSITTATLLYDLGRCGYPKITIEAALPSFGHLVVHRLYTTTRVVLFVCIHSVYSSLKMNRMQTYGLVLELVEP